MCDLDVLLCSLLSRTLGDLERPPATSGLCALSVVQPGQAAVVAPTLCSGQVCPGGLASWSRGTLRSNDRRPRRRCRGCKSSCKRRTRWTGGPAASVKTPGVHTNLPATAAAARPPLSRPLHLRLTLLCLSRFFRYQARSLNHRHVDTTSSTPTGRGGRAVDRLGNNQDIRLQMICDSISITILIITTTTTTSSSSTTIKNL